MPQRGPDGRGFWTAGPAGLAALLFHTTPEAAGAALPFSRPGGSLAVTADVRLDNRAELAAMLGLDLRRPPGVGDAELLLAAYERWGEQAPAYLLGDFAFAIWDQARQLFFCARDHLGIKQLYYHCSDQLFACASEIKALLVLDEIPALLDEARLGDMLALRLDDKQQTLYRGILRLPPATTLTINRDSCRLSTFWQLDHEREIRLRADADYLAAYHDLLSQSVAARLRSSRRVATALSGGLDSSSITVLARQQLAPSGRLPLPTVSAVFDRVPASDERPYIEAVVRQGNITPHFAHLDQHGPLSSAVGGACSRDEPIWSPHAHTSWAIYSTAREHEIGVLLEGMGGDDVVGTGYGYLTELLLQGRWLRLLREAQQLGKHYDRRTWSVMRGPLRALVAERWHGPGNGQAAARNTMPLCPRFVSRMGMSERWSTLDPIRVPAARKVRLTQWLVLTNGLFSAVSVAALDRLAALAGIELRHPFLDRRLVEFCLALPDHLKLKHGWPRWIARAAMRELLPAEVCWRANKSTMTPAFLYGLQAHDREILTSILFEPDSPIAEYVDMPTVREHYNRFLRVPDGETGYLLWSVASLGIWLRGYKGS